MFPPRPTVLAQMLLREIIREGDVVIDATAGNGHDTLFLASLVGARGTVHAFDIQESAIRSARHRLEDAGLAPRVAFHQISHVQMAEFVETGVAVVMFNLGYLPGEDHAVTTTTEGTLSALNAAAGLLKPGGVLSAVCYPGHAEGASEAGAVEEWFHILTDQGWRVARYGMRGTRKPAPFLLMGSKT